MKGVKDTKGKPRFDLVPYDAIAAIAEVREYGNDKYQDPSKWFTGVDTKPLDDGTEKVLTFTAAAARHVAKFHDAVRLKNRSVLDDESTLNHINHALCSLALAVALWENMSYEEKLEIMTRPDSEDYET